MLVTNGMASSHKEVREAIVSTINAGSPLPSAASASWAQTTSMKDICCQRWMPPQRQSFSKQQYNKQDMHCYTSTTGTSFHRVKEGKLLLVLASTMKALFPDDVLSNRKLHASPLLEKAFTELKTELHVHLKRAGQPILPLMDGI